MALQTKAWAIGDLAYQSWSNAYQLRLTLTEQSVDNFANTSTVDYKLELISGGNNRFTYTALYPSLSFGGKQVAYSSEQYSLDYNSSVTLLSGSTTVAHSNDGSLNLAIVAKITPASNRYGPPNMTISESWALTQIARASTIAATDADIGAVSMIAVARKSSAYTHSIQYAFGGLSGYLTDSGEMSATEVKFTAVSVAWRLPDTFYAQIPSAESGLVTLKCRTYSGGTQIGDAETAQFKARAVESDCKPEVSGDVVDVNPTTIALTGSAIRLIRYHSTARATISATARKGARITGKQVNKQPFPASGTIDFSNAETNTFTFEALDSRGYTASATMGRPIVPYVRLTCNVVTAQRTDQTSGNATLALKGNYFAGSFGAADNTLTLRYRVSGGAWQTIAAPTPDGNTYSITVQVSGLEYTSAWDIEVEAADKLERATTTVTIPKGISLFDIFEDRIALNVPLHMGDIAVDYIVEQGTSGIWTYRKWASGIAECWGKRTVNVTYQSTANWGALFSTGDNSITRVAYPFAFASKPMCVAQAELANGNCMLCTAAPLGDASNTPAYQVARPTAAPANASVTVHYFAKGYWK